MAELKTEMRKKINELREREKKKGKRIMTERANVERECERERMRKRDRETDRVRECDRVDRRERM